jgi:hypothetical protein
MRSVVVPPMAFFFNKQRDLIDAQTVDSAGRLFSP